MPSTRIFGRARWPRRARLLLSVSVLAALVVTPAPGEETSYDLPGAVAAAPLLPEKTLASGAPPIAPEADADGLHATFTLDGPDGPETITGIQSLLNRIKEIQAIDSLRRMNKSAEFGKALLASGKEKIESVKEAVKDPVRTAQQLPRGASKFFGRLGNTIKHASEGKIGATQAAEGALGVNRKRAELCLKLGVSPFTRDRTLRMELDLAARAMAAGATLVNVSGLIVGGGVGTALSVVNANQTFQRALIESSPDELAAANRTTLLKLGASPDSVSVLLDNPAFNPWQRSSIAALLASIGVNPEPVLARAGEALGDEDAVYFVQLARILESHHRHQHPIVSIMSMHGIPCALDESGALVVPVGADLIQWTPVLQQRTEEFLAWSLEHPEVKSIVLATDGTVSELATADLTQRGIVVQARVLD